MNIITSILAIANPCVEIEGLLPFSSDAKVSSRGDLPKASPTRHKSAMKSTISNRYRPISSSKRLRACECHLCMIIAYSMCIAIVFAITESSWWP